MPDPAPIRGRWTIYRGRDGLSAVENVVDITPAPWAPESWQACPVPDEAAIERGAKALRRVPRRAVNDEADEGQLREWAEAVLRAALGPEDT